MYKMSKKSFIGRCAMMPVFVPVVIAAWPMEKIGDASFYVRKAEDKLEQFANKYFPLADCED